MQNTCAHPCTPVSHYRAIMVAEQQVAQMVAAIQKLSDKADDQHNTMIAMMTEVTTQRAEMDKLNKVMTGLATDTEALKGNVDVRLAEGETKLSQIFIQNDARLMEIFARIETALVTVQAKSDAQDQEGVRRAHASDAALAAVQAKSDAQDQEIARRMQASEAKVAEALTQLAQAVMASARAPSDPAAGSGGPAHSGAWGTPGAPDPWAGSGQQAGQQAGYAAAPAPAVPDPWATGPSAWHQAPPGMGPTAREPERPKPKDFLGVNPFNGAIEGFPDWADRMVAKFGNFPGDYGRLLEWSERQTDPITIQVEQSLSTSTEEASRRIYDILTERTGPQVFDKRRNAGLGRGLEFWRVLKRDFGTYSLEAQAAKLQNFMYPSRVDTKDLGGALDRWETLGRELGRNVDEDFKFIALKALIPTMMTEQITLHGIKTYADALSFVRRHIADRRNAAQASEVQRQAKVVTKGAAPMDISAVLAALGIETGGGEDVESDGQESASPLDTFIAALRNKGGGKGGGKEETRECFNCGKKGHLARNCLQKAEGKGESKGYGKGLGKSKGYGKGGKGPGKGANALYEEYETDACELSIGCLLAATQELPINACARAEAQGDRWGNFVRTETLLDSGAAECVCGSGHFGDVKLESDPGRPKANTEYVTADGMRIPNLGEKRVHGTTSGGSPLNVRFQVTQVEKPLMAVSKLVDAGHTVQFNEKGGQIVNNRSGRITEFRRKDGVYVLDMWVPAPSDSASGGMRL